MIVATKTVDSLLKGIISPEKLMMSRIDSICKAVQLDPNISTPKKEMYVISNEDIKNPKVRKEFEEAVRSKHISSLVFYINKSGRDLPGISAELFDAYLVKPKKEDIKSKFFELVEEAESKDRFNHKEITEEIEDYEPTLALSAEDVEEVVTDEIISIDLSDIKEVVEEDVIDNSNYLLDRIKRSEHWAAITTIAKEVNASRIVQEIAEVNSSYRHSENYVSSLSENITAIMSNQEYDTKVQLQKVRAILHDRAYIKAKNNSILEQSVEQIITALVDKAKQEVESKTQEMDEKILLAFKCYKANDAPNVRLSTIIEERSKVLIELTALDLEIKGLASQCISTVNDTVDSVISSSSSTTESPILDSQMKSRFGDIVPENLITVLDNLFKTGQESSEEFGKMSEAVHSSIRKLYQLLSYYQEETEVLADTIRYLKANKVEDTVLANTILKKTSRMFINNGDFDSVAMTYIISKHNSRKHNNVMLLDLSGSNVFDLFGIQRFKYSKFMEEDKFDGKFLLVSPYNDPGVVIESIEDCQRLSSRLLHYAKHYSMINIMCTQDQLSVIQQFMSDVMSITYIVDCYPTTISLMANCLKETNIDNTAKRVVLVNYVSDSTTICKDLGIMDKLDTALTTCNPIQAIRYCSLRKQDPYNVESIVEDCRGVLKIC